MLSFNDQAHFQATYDCLEAAYEAHLDAFEAQYGYLSEDDYNDMADQLGFVDEQPLIDFEGAMGFSSYRNLYQSELDVWLSSGNQPDEFPVPDLFPVPTLATLRNKHRAVMINGVINLTDADGSNWQFCDCSEYERFIEDPSDFDDRENDECVSVKNWFIEANVATCILNWKQCRSVEYVNTFPKKRVKLTMWFVYGGGQATTSTHVFSSIAAFRKKNNNSPWRKRFLRLRPEAIGQFYTNRCEALIGFYDEKPMKRRMIRWASNDYGGERTFVNRGVQGRYQWGPNSTQDEEVLDVVSGCSYCSPC